MEITTALVPITETIAEEFFNSQSIETCLKAIEDDALNFVGDPTTAQGRKAIIAKAASVASAKVIIDNVGKKLNEERKRLTDIVNADRKKARDFLDDLKAKVRRPVTEWEEAEAARVEAERLAIQIEMDWNDALQEDDLFNRQKEIERKEAELKAQEEARLEKERKEREEKERAERERRIAQEAKEKAEREAAEKIEAEKRAKIEAETRARLAAEKAERDKKEAAEKAEREKIEAAEAARQKEIERQAEEKRRAEEKATVEREAEEKRARNIAHQKKVNREALEDLISECGCTEEQGKKIITAVSKSKIRNITINY